VAYQEIRQQLPLPSLCYDLIPFGTWQAICTALMLNSCGQAPHYWQLRLQSGCSVASSVIDISSKFNPQYRSCLLVVRAGTFVLLVDSIEPVTSYSHATQTIEVRWSVWAPINPLAPLLLSEHANLFPLYLCRLSCGHLVVRPFGCRLSGYLIRLTHSTL